MLVTHVRRCLFAIALVVAACLAAAYLIGCTSSNPAVAADAMAVAHDRSAIATLTTQPAATQSSTPGGPANLEVAQRKLSDDLTKLATDIAAVKSQQIQQGVAIGQTVAGAVPSPWSMPVTALIGVAGAIGLAYVNRGSVAAVTTTAAASSVNHANVVGQLVDLIAPMLPAKVQAVVKTVETIEPTVTTVTTTTPVTPKPPAA